ncbi:MULTISPECIES: hypothetical protein [unclassified Streptomyces]|uniref:hypothetical protein n=1 Tax=unclassified Streptomyces TaxID=2593676 RepID=UPI0027D9FF8E|nr:MULTISPECIES: hypothetical protein [unclassified Streptomyces]
MRTAYLEGSSIAAPAREHRVSRGVIRTAVAEPPAVHRPPRTTTRSSPRTWAGTSAASFSPWP